MLACHLMKSRCAKVVHRDFFAFYSTTSRIGGFSDTKERRAETTANAAMLASVESGRQPSAICSKLGIPSTFHRPRLPYVLFPFVYGVS